MKKKKSGTEKTSWTYSGQTQERRCYNCGTCGLHERRQINAFKHAYRRTGVCGDKLFLALTLHQNDNMTITENITCRYCWFYKKTSAPILLRLLNQREKDRLADVLYVIDASGKKWTIKSQSWNKFLSDIGAVSKPGCGGV